MKMNETAEFEAFVALHKDQLVSSGVAPHWWKTLHKKLQNEIFNTNDFFEVLELEGTDQEENEYQSRLLVRTTKEIKKLDTQHIYLVDHAWAYRISDAKKLLLEYDSLRERLSLIFNLDVNLDKMEIVNIIFDNMWKLNNHYSLANAEDVESRLPIWYVTDEFGIAIKHSDESNCRMIPFYYINEEITYSLLFPIRDIEEGEILERDYAEGITNSLRRAALLLPWVPQSLENVDINPPLPGADYFLEGHIKECLPNLSNLEDKKISGNTLKVFSQYSLIHSNLNNNKFTLVDNPEEADILWYTDHFKDFGRLSETPQKFINQFPFEYVLTVKDLLCITCKRKPEGLKWLPTSYNLITEIGNFISYFQKRERDGLDNYWIVKPYNLARGLDMHITNNLNYIVRISSTGPKIAQKYITEPVLFYRPEINGKVKFDIRYVLLLESVKPLKAYIYRNFFLRFANKPFELNEFEDYEKHFTVMNYTNNAKLKHMKRRDFLLNWMVQYPDYDWEVIENSIMQMLKDILECATVEEPPCGIAHSPQSRAVYAADIMLEWTEDREITPRILEINFTPDCKRACDYYPDFYVDIFRKLFFNETVDTIIPL